MKTYQQALDDVRAAGIPVRNVGVYRGDGGDYGVIMPGWHTVPRHVYDAVKSWKDEIDDDMTENPENYPRRWAHCDTGAGLAEDDNGDIQDYPKGREILASLGWEYEGSGAYRVEVAPDSIPVETREIF